MQPRLSRFTHHLQYSLLKTHQNSKKKKILSDLKKRPKFTLGRTTVRLLFLLPLVVFSRFSSSNECSSIGPRYRNLFRPICVVDVNTLTAFLMYSRLVVGTSFTRSYTGTRRLAFTSSRSHVFQSISRRSANGHQSVPVPVLNTLTKDKSNYNKLSRFVTSSKALTVEEPTGSHEKGDLFKELTQLSATIRSHDKLYYTSGGTPLVTDEEYDALTQREAEICRAHPELQARLESESGLGSSTTRYGGRVGPVIPVLEGEQILTTRIIKEKRAHLETSPMQSLDNAMNGEQVVNWINRVRKLLNTTDDDMEEKVGEKNGVNIIAEPKMDGLSLSLRYKLQDAAVGRYQLQWGATRGDGKRGEDVTEAVLAMDRGKLTSNGEQGGIPMSFTCFGLPDIVEIRGEVVLPTSTFSELSQNTTISDKESKVDNAVESSGTLGHFSNARNAASGILLRRKAESELSDQEVKDTQELRSYLRFYAYSIGLDMKGNDELCTSGVELRNFLETIGFTVANPVEIAYIPFNTTEDITEKECQALFTYHDRIMSNRLDYNGQNASSVPFDFDVDGAVYKISVLDDRRRIGSSSRAPRWAIAHKFPAQCAVTRLLGVEVQIGRTGALTPVAVLEPVDIGGVTVSRASLHNFAWAKALLADDDESFNGDRVPKGASVMISRAGDVIPQVLKRLDNEATFVQNKTDDDIDYISLTPPRKCPACGSESVFELIQGKCKPPEEGNDDENGLPSEESLTEYSQNSSITESPSTGQVLRCGGPQLFCPPRAIGAMAHTFSRSGLDISGLSEARLQQLNNASLIQLPSDLFDVLDAESTILDQIASLPGWGEKSAMNLKHAVQATSEKEVPLNQFIYSLGIRHVGVHNSDLIASAYGSVSHFFDAVKESSHANNSNSNDNSEPVDVFPDLVGTDDVEGVKGIGPVIIDSLVIFSKNSELVEAAECLASKLNIKDMIVSNESPTKQIDLPFDGKTVVFTGSLPNGMTRKQAQSLAMTSLGAKSTPGSVSKATGIVIEGDKGGKKVEKAKELGVTVMSADDFIALAEKYK